MSTTADVQEEEKWGIAFGLRAQQTITKTFRKIKLQRFRHSASPLQVFSALSKNTSHCFLLESGEGAGQLAQYSFIGFSPTRTIKAKGGNYEEVDSEGHAHKTQTDDPFSGMRKILEENLTTYCGFRFVGGLVGYFSYDAVRYLESLPNLTEDDLQLPDLEFGVYDDGIVYDHSTAQAYYYWYNHNRLQEVEYYLNQGVECQDLSSDEPRSNMGKDDFESVVHKAKNFIKRGDIFQVVLSKRFKCSYKGDLINFYRSLRAINPSPYMYFLKMKDRAIVGSSPEMLGRVEARTIETFPIAGTRPVALDKRENERLQSELIHDPKERAEHIMLIDLARNDLGKVCEYGSIKVSDFMTIQKFSHVQHIVSRVAGQLRSDQDSVDVFRSIFPAGTVSGAPKRRAMEIIEELERYRRGPYAGAVGYFSYNGNADFAITIRTLIADRNRAYIQAGAGIVADSKPSHEWAETEHKARALLQALKARGN